MERALIANSENNQSQFIIYQTEDGETRLDVRFQNETVWLPQSLIADLFHTPKQNIGQHLKNIFLEQELTEKSVVKNFFTTAADGKHYNLDAIISVGYRVQSRIAPCFVNEPLEVCENFHSKYTSK